MEWNICYNIQRVKQISVECLSFTLCSLVIKKNYQSKFVRYAYRWEKNYMVLFKILKKPKLRFK